MFERFTDRARRALVLSQEESRLLNHGYIGTEHLLLGLLAEEKGVAAQVLAELGVTPVSARDHVKEIVGVGEESPTGHIPFTPRAKKVFELGLQEALQLGHNYIGTEHFLLGMIAEGGGVGVEVLRRLGVDPDRARQRVIKTLGGAAPSAIGTPLRRHVYDPAMVSVLFVAVALVAVVIEAPEPQIRLWGLSLLLGGTLLWAGGAVIGTGDLAGPRSKGMGRLLRVLGGLTLAAAASVFVLGALLQ